MDEKLVIRSAPRVVADIRDLRPTPVWLVVLLAGVGLVWLRATTRGPGNYSAVGLSILGIAAVIGLVTAAKAVNSRVVITPDYVESRDALRRTRRCDRRTLASWVFVRARLSKVLMLDGEGKTQLSLAWDSYSDEKLAEIRRAIGLPDHPRREWDGD